ncbi:hypothetical protein OG218_01875 [Kineococcus sp. NBC_00420]|uniref:hypothetical protein n=1 Tax=Kineococcus sp. NBC_00420 TaxID=2903564 RepID=UPI002E21B8E2
MTDPTSSSRTDVDSTADDGTGIDGTSSDQLGGQDSGEDMTGASHQEVADLVDELEEKALAEAGDPQHKIAEEAHTSGTDRAAGDAEPPV